MMAVENEQRPERVSIVDIPRKKQPKGKRYAIIGGSIALGILLITFGLSRLRAAAPVVDKASLWTDSVKRGEMLREVKGPGTLAPEQIRFITADTAGRVERIPLRPGAPVQPGTVLLELSNPDVMLQTLDAERRAKADEQLRKDGVISGVEANQTIEHAKELRDRLVIEKNRLGIVSSAAKDQVAAQEQQIQRLKAVVAFRRQQVESMKVKSVDKGVLSQLPLELGQWVTPGATLAQVVQPEKLKAVLRIPETQARDLALGLPAAIDTRNGIVQGKVSRISPSANQGSVEVDVALPAELPKGARPDLTIEGTIQIEKLPNVLYVGRPAGAQAEGQTELFKVVADEGHRVKVRLGRSSVSTVEILDGLSEGDTVILSDMSQWDATDRVRLK